MTDTIISQLPTGTIDSLRAIFPISIGIGSSPETIQSEVQAVFEFGYMGYAISPSVTNGTLTLTIQRENAANPAAAYPVRFQLGTGFYYLTSPTSFSAASGTNWCNAGGSELVGQDVDFFVYAIEETGASAGLKFGFSRIPYAETMNDFVNTSTDEKYIKGNWTNFNTSDKVKNIGRFRARLSSGNVWSIPTSKVVNRPIYETDWMTYTPTRTNVTPGTGPTASDLYQIKGRNIDVYNAYILGTGGSLSGALGISLPFAPNSTVLPAFTNVGWGLYRPTSGARYSGSLLMNAGATVINVSLANGTYVSDTSVTNTVPMTWTTGDRFVLRYAYPIG